MSNPHSTISPPPLLKNTTETPAINSVPVELDSTPTTAEAVELKRRSTNPSVAVLSPDLEEAEVLKELGIESAGGGGGAEGEKLREKRAKMLASRSKDPAVLVDLPNFPTADEVAAAKATEGTVTPGLGAGGGDK